MVKQFVILPSDRDWADIARAMQAKGMPVEVQDGEVIITAWHRGWTQKGVTVLEFAEPGDLIGADWIRPDEPDPEKRRQQRQAEQDALLASIPGPIDQR